MIVISLEEYALILMVNIYKKAKLVLIPNLNRVIVVHKIGYLLIPCYLHVGYGGYSSKNELSRTEVKTKRLNIGGINKTIVG